MNKYIFVFLVYNNEKCKKLFLFLRLNIMVKKNAIVIINE